MICRPPQRQASFSCVPNRASNFGAHTLDGCDRGTNSASCLVFMSFGRSKQLAVAKQRATVLRTRAPGSWLFPPQISGTEDTLSLVFFFVCYSDGPIGCRRRSVRPAGDRTGVPGPPYVRSNAKVPAAGTSALSRSPETRVKRATTFPPSPALHYPMQWRRTISLSVSVRKAGRHCSSLSLLLISLAYLSTEDNVSDQSMHAPMASAIRF